MTMVIGWFAVNNHVNQMISNVLSGNFLEDEKKLTSVRGKSRKCAKSLLTQASLKTEKEII